ncbi:unnamed protein product (macronuclear) [Paramecium tetraurelia]|uniref:Uncharacterized protein n=1 Tax=Paramecium tetraurelia TaxID=5888 RepID=A0BL20_PARTE|nr:uncharacterized protein GSPATT00029868001 [Paramecium tetraurelia]CAK59237.1 unnamed protein product [Paramecium tetraurelia]|eukprot:XP_001426635.1 hypothetical protein (macronuclear) [Paramecium tetraurelia strain d4-2]
MSCIIQLTNRAKRSLSQNPTRQPPHKIILPKLFVERERAISLDRRTQNKKVISNSPKPFIHSPKLIAKSAQTEFNHLKLSQCSKQSVVLEGKQFKNTISRKLRQLPINSNDFCQAGFETSDTEFDDFSLEAYLKRQ